MLNIQEMELRYQDLQRMELLNETDFRFIKGEINQVEYEKTLSRIRKEYNAILASIKKS